MLMTLQVCASFSKFLQVFATFYFTSHVQTPLTLLVGRQEQHLARKKIE